MNPEDLMRNLHNGTYGEMRSMLERLRDGSDSDFDSWESSGTYQGYRYRGGQPKAAPWHSANPEQDSDFDPGADRPIPEKKGSSKSAPEKSPAPKVETPPAEETMEEILEELNQLIGLEDIKTSITTLVNLLKVQKLREEAELPTISIGLHQVFSGNPGTGKTTVARYMGRIYKAAGRISKGQLVETDREGLVARYVGQTASKTLEKLEAARGGVLFIDEAYALSSSGSKNDFGGEAITTILKFMEDNREDFVLIVAGYPKEMEEFMSSNPGLESRFNTVVDFPDYSAEELLQIFLKLTEKHSYHLTEDAEVGVLTAFEKLVEQKTKNFANGRTARKYFEVLVQAQANRLAMMKGALDHDALSELTLEDVQKARSEG